MIICYFHTSFPFRMATFPALNVCACAGIKEAWSIHSCAAWPLTKQQHVFKHVHWLIKGRSFQSTQNQTLTQELPTSVSV